MDMEKVKKGLECHQIDKDHRINCLDCPYHCDEFMNGLNELHNDAIALLKEQEKQKFFVDESGKITPLPVVVRCKDCKHMEEFKFDDDLCWCSIHEFARDKEYFCADGELVDT